MRDVVFAHGLEGGPWGRKHRALVSAGLSVVVPDQRGLALAARVDGLLPLLQVDPAPVLVGSSYGGLAALCAAVLHMQAGGRLAGLVLCAPALRVPELPATRLDLAPPLPLQIFHGQHDEVVPFAVSAEYAAAHLGVTLHAVADDHGLAASVAAIVACTKALAHA